MGNLMMGNCTTKKCLYHNLCYEGHCGAPTYESMVLSGCPGVAELEKKMHDLNVAIVRLPKMWCRRAVKVEGEALEPSWTRYAECPFHHAKHHPYETIHCCSLHQRKDGRLKILRARSDGTIVRPKFCLNTRVIIEEEL